jgi:hypothetical protein
MAAHTNETSTKKAGPTDITFTAVAPSAGDKSPAVWRSQTVGSAAAHQPEMRLTARSNGPGTARRVEGVFVYPALVTGSDGKISISDKFILQFSGVVPLGMATVDVNEAASQGANFIAHAQLKDALKTGFAST